MIARVMGDPTPDFVVIDGETACSRVSSICQVGIVGFRDGHEIFAWETLLDPCDEFQAGNTRIHGIAAHHVAGQPTFAHVHDVIDRHLTGRITVAHSLFDKGALAAACRVHDRQAIETRWLDSVRVARRAWPDLDNHRLGGLARFLGVPHRHHDALSDARAAGWAIVRAIEHTGLSLADWMAPPRQPGPAPNRHRTDRSRASGSRSWASRATARSRTRSPRGAAPSTLRWDSPRPCWLSLQTSRSADPSVRAPHAAVR